MLTAVSVFCRGCLASIVRGDSWLYWTHGMHEASMFQDTPKTAALPIWYVANHHLLRNSKSNDLVIVEIEQVLMPCSLYPRTNPIKAQVKISLTPLKTTFTESNKALWETMFFLCVVVKLILFKSFAIWYESASSFPMHTKNALKRTFNNIAKVILSVRRLPKQQFFYFAPATPLDIF